MNLSLDFPQCTIRDQQTQGLGILQMLASMEPLDITLQHLAQTVSGFVPGGRALILLVKGHTLTVAAAAGFAQCEIDEMASMPVSRIVNSGFGNHGATTDLVIRTVFSGAGEVLAAIAVGPAEKFAHCDDVARLWETLESLAALTIEQNNLVEELNYRLEHDSLTDVYDRLSIERRMAEALSDALVSSGQSASRVALIVIGIDGLRRVNAALGHPVGNGLLRQAAQRMQRDCGIKAILGRAGGDEFFVLIPRMLSKDEAARTAERLLKLLKLPYLIGDHELKVTAAAGIAISSADAYRPEDLQARAYTALEYAKSLGGGEIAFFDCSMASVSPQYLELETRLRGALAGRELLLYYQPQVDLQNLTVVGVEALLRWQHPGLGLVSPCSFIPMAEQGGLISEIGDWAVEEAIRQLSAWEKLGLGKLRVAINVSPVQFRRKDFARRIFNILERTSVEPGTLMLEITEGTLMHDIEYSIVQINRLRGLGIRFAIDDFGTGYSSLAYLQRLPADFIKIDRSFIQEIRPCDRPPPLLVNILRMADELRIPTIAEGVETQEQADQLTAMNCQVAQGFLFSKPLPAFDLPSWFRRSGELARRSIGPRPPNALKTG